MALDESKVQKAVEEFRKNPYWREYYDNAPTENCKRYVALEFYIGEYLDLQSPREEIMKLREIMTLQDFVHLYKYVGHNPLKGLYRGKIVALGGKDPWKSAK